MKNIYYPDNEDILEWLSSDTDEWPDSNWDFCVISEEKNDNIVFRLANDRSCHMQWFFVHCLYYLVGEYWDDDSKRQRINQLLKMADSHVNLEVTQWENEATEFLSGKVSFDPHYWLNQAFQEDYTL